MKNTFFTILVCMVFASTVFGTFYFWLKANKIGLKNKNGLDRLFSKLSPEERIWQKKYLRKAILCFTCGVLIIVLLYFIFGIGDFFEK